MRPLPAQLRRALTTASTACVVAVLTAGCELLLAAGGAVEPGPISPRVWQAEPIKPDPAIARLAHKLCIDDTGVLNGIVADLPMVLQDQRGPDAAFLIWAAGYDQASCLVVRRPDGSFAAGAVSASGATMAAGRLAVSAQEMGPPQIISGESGDAARVVIGLADGSSFAASVGQGRFAGWWPAGAPAVRVTSFDVNGGQLDQVAVEPFGQLGP